MGALISGLLAALATLAAWCVSHPLLTYDLYVAIRDKDVSVDRIFEILGSDEIKGIVANAICELARQKGFELLPDDPLSDASIAHALSEKSGIEIRSLMEADKLLEDFSNYVSGEIERKTGLKFTNVLDADAIQNDAAGIAAGLLKEKTGIVLSDVTDMDKVKLELKLWAVDKFTDAVKADIAGSASVFGDKSGDLLVAGEGLRAGIKENREMGDVLTDIIANQVAVMATRLKKRLHLARRQAQNRESQRRFRLRHGSRMRYEKMPRAEGAGGG